MRPLIVSLACSAAVLAAAAPAHAAATTSAFKKPPRALTKAAQKHVTTIIKRDLPRSVSARCRPGKPRRGERGRWRCTWSGARKLTLYRSDKCRGTLAVTRKKGRWRRSTISRRRCAVQTAPGSALVGFSETWAFDRLGAARMAPIVANSGARIHRLVVDWRSVEPYRGTLHWGHVDMAVSALEARGVKVLLTILFAPAWAVDAESRRVCGGGCRRPPAREHTADFADFAAKAARRYPNAAGIEIWNEPNLITFWQPRPDAGHFTQLLRASYDAIKAVDREMPVIAGGFGNLHESNVEGVGFAAYLADVYAAGGRGHMDAIGLHDYPYSLLDSAITYSLNEARRVRNAAGDNDLPLWITETGISTTGSGIYAFSEAQQASGLVNILGRLRAQPDVEAIMIHTLVEQSALPSALGELGGYGVLRSNLSRKPAYCWIANYLGKPC